MNNSTVIGRVQPDRIETFPEQLAERVAGLIGQGELRPGQQLDPRVIGPQFGASDQSARRAFRILVQRGLVTIRPSRGAYVSGGRG